MTYLAMAEYKAVVTAEIFQEIRQNMYPSLSQ